MDRSKSNISGKKSNIDTSKSNIFENKSNIDTSKSNISGKKSNNAVRKMRYSKEELIKLICDFCSEWRTAEEIALYVNRELKYIAKVVLHQLDDVIEKMYNIPHHPRQKYRAKQQLFR